MSKTQLAKPKLIFRANANKVGETREETVGERVFLVAPVIAIVEGVLNQWLVTADAIKNSVEDWEGIPLTVNHPADDEGNHVSIHSGDLLEKTAIGEFRNVHFSAELSALAGEIWVDVERARLAGDEGVQILEMLRANEPLEVSTGYFVPRLERRAGVFNGEAFREVHHALSPDHLALLPNAVGACSWSDGCGAPRVNLKEVRTLNKAQERLAWLKTLIEGGPNGLSLDGLRVNGKKLGEMLTRMVSDQAGATMSKDAIVKRMAEVAGISVEKVTQVMAGDVDFPPRKWLQSFALALDVDYADLIIAADVDTIPFRRPEPGAFNESEHTACGCRSSEVHMNKKEKVNALIANKRTQFAEEDREWLMSLPTEKLDRLVPNEEAGDPPASDPPAQDPPASDPPAQDPPASDPPAQDPPASDPPASDPPASDPPASDPPAPAPAANAGAPKKPAKPAAPAPAPTPAREPAKPKNAEEWLATMPDDARDIFAPMVNEAKENRTRLIKALVKNDRCPLDETELSRMTTNTLQALAESYEIEDYSGAGGGSGEGITDNENTVPPPPSCIGRKN